MHLAALGFAFEARAAKNPAPMMIYPEYLVKVTTADQQPLALNAHTSFLVTLEAQSKAAPAVVDLSFDARMPEHKHGMVTKPKITKLSPTSFRVDGVRLHMPGKWLLHFVLKYEQGETEITSPFWLNAK